MSDYAPHLQETSRFTITHSISSLSLNTDSWPPLHATSRFTVTHEICSLSLNTDSCLLSVRCHTELLELWVPLCVPLSGFKEIHVMSNASIARHWLLFGVHEYDSTRQGAATQADIFMEIGSLSCNCLGLFLMSCSGGSMLRLTIQTDPSVCKRLDVYLRLAFSLEPPGLYVCNRYGWLFMAVYV